MGNLATSYLWLIQPKCSHGDLLTTLLTFLLIIDGPYPSLSCIVYDHKDLFA